MKSSFARVETRKQLAPEQSLGLAEHIIGFETGFRLVVDAKAIDHHEVGPGGVPAQFLGQPVEAKPWFVLRLGPTQIRVAGGGNLLVPADPYRVTDALSVRAFLGLQPSQVIKYADPIVGMLRIHFS